jgi:hypothetical protein
LGPTAVSLVVSGAALDALAAGGLSSVHAVVAKVRKTRELRRMSMTSEGEYEFVRDQVIVRRSAGDEPTRLGGERSVEAGRLRQQLGQ